MPKAQDNLALQNHRPLKLNVVDWPAIALLSSASLIAAAHVFQSLGYAPCALCLRQREAHWLVIAISLVALLAQRLRPNRTTARWFVAALGLAFLWSAGNAAFHAGVEWKFWPGPPTCSGGGQMKGPIDMSAALSGPQIVIMCDEAAWRLAGISMAGYNALISIGLAAASFFIIRQWSATHESSDDRR